MMQDLEDIATGLAQPKFPAVLFHSVFDRRVAIVILDTLTAPGL
jgi:hypothetical protein